MAAELQETIALLRQHLELAGIRDGSQQVWTLAPSPLGGRGVVATRDIQAGELIFYDAPLVVGPRAGVHCPPVCAGCHEGPKGLEPCSRGCGLPICSVQCESTIHHLHECEKLRSWGVHNGQKWSSELLRASTPIRCLALNPLQKRVLESLQAHVGSQHGFEVDFIKRNTEVGPSPEEEAFMRLACFVMDANAFETTLVHSDSSNNNKKSIATEELRPLNGTMPSLRGLYPLAAMMNHACTPNTRHTYDENQRMIVRATVKIPAGTEITNSYTALLWGTPARRHHLQHTKHFLCECPRCADPQEGGSRLAALKCLTQTCQGSMFPVHPVDEESKWQCEDCGREVTGRKAALTQSTLGRLLGTVDCKNPIHMERFLKEHHLIAPTSNQIIVEVKCCIIRIYGHHKDYMWPDLTVEQLAMKETLCRDVLQLLIKLGAGQCRMRGLLLYELHCTLMELYARNQGDTENKLTNIHLQQALAAVEESVYILGEDVSAPLDLLHRQKACKELMKSL